MRLPETRRSRYRIPIAAAIAAIALLGAACSGGLDSEESEEKVTTEDQVEIVDGVLQPVWVLDRVVGIDLEGDEVDMTDELVEFVGEDADEPAEFSAQATFATSSTLKPRMLDVADQPLDTVDMLGGVLDIDGDRHVAILATPDEGEWLIGKNHSLWFDIPEIDGITDGLPLVVDYVYVQYLPVEGATGLGDEAQTPLELIRERARVGAIAFQDDGFGNSQMMTGEVGVARTADQTTTQDWASNSNLNATPAESARNRNLVAAAAPPAQHRQIDPDELAKEVADRANDALVDKISEEVADEMGIPADARPLIDGIIEGAKDGLDGKCRSFTCIKNLTDKIRDGFEESLDLIDDKLVIDPPDREKVPEREKRPNIPDTPNPPKPKKTPRTNPPPPPTVPPNNPDGPPGDNPDNPPGDNPPGDNPNEPPGDNPDAPPGDSPDPDDPPGDSPDPDGPPGGSPDGGGRDKTPGPGASKTDPHIVTFDGRSYGFQVIGEFVVARSDDLEVQARYEPVPCDCLASITTGVAVSDGETRVQVTFADQAAIKVDGEPIDMDEEGFVEAGDLQVERTGTGVDITDASNNLVTVAVRKHNLNLFVTRGDDAGWQGIFGNANGEPDDDFETRDGESLGTMPRDEVIVGAFADSWRISQDESLFDYGQDETTETFADATYPQPNPEISESELENDREARTNQATAVCEAAGVTDPQAQEDCEFDFTVTGNASFVNENRLAERFERHARSSTSTDADNAGDDKPDSAQGGTTLKGSELSETRGGSLATGDGLVLVRVADDEDRLRLHAIDLTTHAERWTSDDVNGHCRPVVLDGIGVVAQLEPGSETLGDDDDALVLLSSENGSELARFTPSTDDKLGRCDTALIGDDDLVVHHSGTTTSAFRVDDDITPLWDLSDDEADGVAVEKVGGSLVVGARSGTEYTFDAVDLDSGEVVSSTKLDAGELRSMRAAGDDGVSVVMRGSDKEDLPPTLSLLKVDDGKISTVFTQENGPDDPGFPQQLARQGDLLVGWTKHAKGDGLIAYNVSDGETAWTYKTTSFDNQHGLVDATTDVAMVGPFGGAWLELVDSDGEQFELRDAPGEYSHAVQFTVLDDDTVIVSGDSKEGPYVEFVNI